MSTGPSNAQDESREKTLTRLADSGRTWKALRGSIEFKQPAPLFDQPMEISVQMLRGLRMVDETIVVHGDVPSNSREEDKHQ